MNVLSLSFFCVVISGTQARKETMHAKAMVVARWCARTTASSSWPAWLAGASDVVVSMYQVSMSKCRRSLDGLTKLLA